MKTISTLCFFLISYLISAQTTYLHCGEVFDAKKGKFVGPHTIVVEGDRIKSVEKGYQLPENVNTNIIDLKSKTVYPGSYPAIIVPKAIEIGAQIQNTFKKAYEFGVPLAFGTDAGVYPHGDNAKEFIYKNEVGMPISEALHLATYVNADLLDEADQLGQLKSGYFADIVATDENPEDEISTLTNVSFVMKNGTVYKN